MGYFYFLFLSSTLSVAPDEELEDLGNVPVRLWITSISLFRAGEAVRKSCYFSITLPFEPNFSGFFLPAKSLEVSLLRVRGSKYRDGDIRLKGVILYVGGH